MSVKSYKPYTPSRRAMISMNYEEVTKKTPEKSLVVTLKKSGGRNNQGVITCRHIGGGNKTKYRIIDFNDWPSFSHCINEAAKAITQYITNHLSK